MSDDSSGMWQNMQPLGILAPASEALKKDTIRCFHHSESTIQNKYKLLHPYLQIFVRHNSLIKQLVLLNL